LKTSRTTLLAVAFGFLLVGCGGTVAQTPATSPTPIATPVPSPSPIPSPVDVSKMIISIDSTFIKTVAVGSSTDFNLDIQDVGTVDIPYLSILFNAGDHFLDIYTVTSSTPCTIDTVISGIACGRLAQGAHLVLTITAKPNTAGSYVFKFSVTNYKQILKEADGNQYVYSWTQTVSS
jgi:hypothetical protein